MPYRTVLSKMDVPKDKPAKTALFYSLVAMQEELLVFVDYPLDVHW
jgi:hypothetical protein